MREPRKWIVTKPGGGWNRVVTEDELFPLPELLPLYVPPLREQDGMLDLPVFDTDETDPE